MVRNAVECISSRLVFVPRIFAYFIEKDSAPSLVGSSSLHWMMATDWAARGESLISEVRLPPGVSRLSSLLLTANSHLVWTTERFRTLVWQQNNHLWQRLIVCGRPTSSMALGRWDLRVTSLEKRKYRHREVGLCTRSFQHNSLCRYVPRHR